MEPTDLCDDLVEFFDTHKEKQQKGATAIGIDPNIKKTVDMTIQPKDLELVGYEVFNSYIEELFLCYKDYVEQWPFLAETLIGLLHTILDERLGTFESHVKGNEN